MARSDKLPRDPGLPKELPDVTSWLRALVSRLNSLIPRQHDTVNSLVDGYLLHVGSLPAPNEANRGRMVILRGASGSADRLFWCKKRADDTYVWQEVL